MQFNSNATNQDLCSYANRLVGLPASNTDEFSLVDKTLFANEAQRIIWSVIHDSYGGWIFDDKNNTDFPEATTTLTSGQQDYALPSDTSFVMGVAVKNQSGDWHDLMPLTLEQIKDHENETEFQSTNGEPKYYRLISNSVKTYPASNYTQSASLKVYYVRDISGFATTDTTKTPGFDTVHHEAVAVYMALQHARINQISNKNDLENQWSTHLARIRTDFSNRFKELFPPRLTVRDATQEYQ